MRAVCVYECHDADGADPETEGIVVRAGRVLHAAVPNLLANADRVSENRIMYSVDRKPPAQALFFKSPLV